MPTKMVSYRKSLRLVFLEVFSGDTTESNDRDKETAMENNKPVI